MSSLSPAVVAPARPLGGHECCVHMRMCARVRGVCVCVCLCVCVFVCLSVCMCLCVCVGVGGHLCVRRKERPCPYTVP